MRHTRKRDANERAIIDALRTHGCAVAQLDGTGIPDLIVEYNGVLTLVEVKDIKPGKTRPHKENKTDPAHAELTESQVKWWRSWTGRPPVIVHSVDEALRAIVVMGKIDRELAFIGKLCGGL